MATANPSKTAHERHSDPMYWAFEGRRILQYIADIKKKVIPQIMAMPSRTATFAVFLIRDEDERRADGRLVEVAAKFLPDYERDGDTLIEVGIDATLAQYKANPKCFDVNDYDDWIW